MINHAPGERIFFSGYCTCITKSPVVKRSGAKSSFYIMDLNTVNKKKVASFMQKTIISLIMLTNQVSITQSITSTKYNADIPIHHNLSFLFQQNVTHVYSTLECFSALSSTGTPFCYCTNE